MKLEHLGCFRLPAGQQAHDPDLAEPLKQYAKFGYGGRAMGMMYQGNKALLVSGHNIGDLIAAVRIPKLGETAEVRIGFRELVPAAELFVNRLDELVGVAEHQGKVVGLYQRYYQVDGKDGGIPSFWDGEQLIALGTGELKKSSGYLTSHDSKLYVGRSSGAGNADINQGPCLYEVLPDYGLIERFRHDRPDWSPADDYRALAFLPGCVVWLVRKAVGAPAWYGGPVGPNGEVDPFDASKGYHSDSYEARLLAYKWPIVPGDEGEILKLDGFHESSDAGGMAFDGGTSRLYVFEAYPPDETTESGAYRKERPHIHVYSLEAGGASEPEPEPEPPTKKDVLHIKAWNEDGQVFEGDIIEVED